MAGVNTFLAADSTKYRVCAVAVQIAMIDGSNRHIYKGSRLPADVSPKQLEHLIASGMVEEVVKR